MSEEEKDAIETLKNIDWYLEGADKEEYSVKILMLIELVKKQQKEIEQLKNEYIPKQKILDKIEEVYNINDTYSDMRLSAIKRLQELLEKE